MDGERQLTDAERAEIESHARRFSAYLGLRKLYVEWMTEINLQDRMDWLAMRFIGCVVSVGALLGTAYTVFLLHQLIFASSASAIVVARKSMWYLAMVAVLAWCFVFGLWFVSRRLATPLLPVYWHALNAAMGLFVLGLVVAPLIAWLAAS